MQIEWNKVTWYSKTIALILFVGIFVLGLYLGSEYQKAESTPVAVPQKEIISNTQAVKDIESQEKFEKQAQEKMQQTPAETTITSKAIIPADLGIKIGDTIGDFILTEFKGNYLSSGEPLSEDSILISYFAQFTGTSDIQGIIQENEMLGGWCFLVSESDYAHVPRLKYDKRNPWFCFKNPDDIPEDVRKNNSEQKIRISGYGLNFVAKGSSDVTTFVKVMN